MDMQLRLTSIVEAGDGTLRILALGACLFLLAFQEGAHADTIDDYFDHWFDRVDQAQSSQPHWMTPIATVTPRLEEEVRFDEFWEKLPNNAKLDNIDGGKGLELIPTENAEVIFGVPPYQIRSEHSPASGFSDYPFLLVKYRLMSANENEGNYIVTAFLQGSAPTGIEAFTSHEYAITPTLAFGKGWGAFDVQATVGSGFPIDDKYRVGDTLVSNVAFQYQAGLVWPEIELNDTYWYTGERSGKNQLFLTPGVILGRFKLGGRSKLIIGAGYQVALTPKVQLAPPTPTYKSNWILTIRLGF